MSFDGWYEALRGAGSAYRRVQRAAFGPGQLVGQQGLCTADEILDLAQALRLRPGGRLLDVCCGLGGPAGLLAARLGCQVVGLDRSAWALGHATRHRGSGVRLVRADAVRLPFRAGSFQAALVLDSLASIFEPAALLGELRRVLAPGGRLGCTLEVGEPLQDEERERLEPGVDACILPLERWLELIDRAGFRTLRAEDETARRAAVAGRLVDGLARERAALGEELGAEAVGGLTATLSAWADFLTRGRLRAMTLVAERPATPTRRVAPRALLERSAPAGAPPG